MLDFIMKIFKKKGRSLNHDLVILDDVFPHLLSAFRISEYNSLLQHFSGAYIYSTGITFTTLGEGRDFKAVHADYSQLYPEISDRVKFFDSRARTSARLCYLMFLNNAYQFIDYIEQCKMPFVLELYPGGGFQLDDEVSDQKLRRVTASPFLRKIIVTQKISYDYLINNSFCQSGRVELIFGGVSPQEQLLRGLLPRKHYPVDKQSFDICFVAHKYMPQGRDKGYDAFVETAHMLAASHPEMCFHVVGPFGPDDLPVMDLGDRIRFYGSRTTDFFPGFYGGMDMIVSPNVPFVLRPGAFDGFPTGACVEAALCGVAVFCCDELGLNPFVADKELVIIPREPAEIARTISHYIDHPEQLYNISQLGQQRFKDVFSYRKQIEPRIKLLENLLYAGTC